MTTPESKASRAGRDLPVAIGVGVALFLVLGAGLIWAPWVFVAIVAVGLGLAAIEVHLALLRKGMRAEITPIAIGTVVSVLGGYLAARSELLPAPSTFIVLCLSATLIAALVTRLFRGAEGFLRDVSASAFIIGYIPLLGVFLPLLMSPADGRLRVLAVIACVVAADTGAYATGVAFGRHKMAPAISPSKTWEGFVGAVLSSVLVGVALAVVLLGAPWWVGALLGLFVAPAATVGDLVESLIKRDAGLKDMSNFLPGHGGIMDRLDSMLVAVPVGWLILHLALGG